MYIHIYIACGVTMNSVVTVGSQISRRPPFQFALVRDDQSLSNLGCCAPSLGAEGLEQLLESDACTVRRDDREDSRRHKPTASKLECNSYL
jgi:hypothetical protein